MLYGLGALAFLTTQRMQTTDDQLVLFEQMYDQLSPMLYGIAVRVSASQTAAEAILAATFYEAFERNLVLYNKKFLQVVLIKLLLQKARVQLESDPLRDGLKLKYFEHMPIIHNLLCQHTNLVDYCTEQQCTHKEVASAVRGEFVAIQNLLAGKMSVQNQS